MKQHYHLKASPYKGVERFACNYCVFQTHLEFRFGLHMEAFHPEKLIDEQEVIHSLQDLPKADLVELAEKKGVAIRGSKQDIIERLEAEE